MIPNLIHKVLSTFQSCGVRALLMGGQACVFNGAAGVSWDTDFAILANAANLERLDTALRELRASVIAVPPLSLEYLERGHAVHFCCQHVAVAVAAVVAVFVGIVMLAMVTMAMVMAMSAFVLAILMIVVMVMVVSAAVGPAG